MNVTMIGMGYVGLVSGAVFAKHGFPTICTGTTRAKVEKLNQGIPPFYEQGLNELVSEVVGKEMLSASLDNIEAVRQSDVVFICVGTPSLPDGAIDLSHVKAVAADVGKALKAEDEYTVVVSKSTVTPSTTDSVVLPILERYSGKNVGTGFGLCMNPEFLREGNAVYDATTPDRIVVGEYDKRSGDRVMTLYDGFSCPKFRTNLRTAEMVKYAANALLATKITFANEIANLCETLGIDVSSVMHGVGLDHRINAAFLRAGAGWGGSCFPKDVRALVALANEKRNGSKLFSSILDINDSQPLRVVELAESVTSLNGKKVALLGLSFKPETDDVRETRALPIAEALLQKGAELLCYDPKAASNFKKLLDVACVENLATALKDAELCIVQVEWDEFKQLEPEDFKRLMKTPIVIDGRRTFDPEKMISSGITYKAIGWKNR